MPASTAQYGVGAMQLLSLVHCTHRPFIEQYGVELWAQSMFDRHCTQVEVIVLQICVGGEHCALLMHPALHWNSCGSQMGCAVPQLAFDRHWTHRTSPRKQKGSPAGQAELVPCGVFVIASHCTHCWVVGSQILRTGSAAQSMFVLHWTHAPVDVQIDMSFGHAVFAAQGAWQV